MTERWGERGDPLREPPEADAVEQQQTVVDDPDAELPPTRVPMDATAADVAEQSAAVPGERDGFPPTLPVDANPADVLEQRTTVNLEEERRD
ncbi:hypothetical protein [Micromonospora deserti]|uniref:Uncharacterized protein n=1 Tax=Micromonospora deserti TaxID=2070366 RepID=A0A2W2CSI9_9ACTN|nr:hypothetical protein [Micromonospora deserti]PZG01553.1 hypothetical protein C1I99_06620 [Micromonospora deserti]